MKRPGVTRYVQIEGSLYDKDILFSNEPESPKAPTVLIDCYAMNETVSPVDHTLIDSRRKLREHNKRNDVIDVGNDGAAKRRSRPKLDMGNLRGDIERAYHRVEHGYV